MAPKKKSGANAKAARAERHSMVDAPTDVPAAMDQDLPPSHTEDLPVVMAVVPPPNEDVPVVPPSHVAAVEQHVPVELATSAALPAATSVHPRPVGAPPRGVGGQAKVWDTVHGGWHDLSAPPADAATAATAVPTAIPKPLRRTPAAERYRRIRSAADAARAGARALRASRAARSLALGLGHQPLDHAPAALLPALARTLALALEAHSGRVAPLNTLQHAPGIGALGRGHHPPDDAAEGPLAARVRPSLARPLLGRRRRPLLGALVELRLHPSLWHLCGKQGGRWMVGTSV